MKKSKSFITLCKKLDVDPDKIPEITSFEDACKAGGLDPNFMPDFSGIPEKHRKHFVADYKLIVIAEALREQWLPNYSNTNERKYFAWFEVKADAKNPSGFGLSCFVCDLWDSYSNVGVRLCFPNYDMAEYFGKQFIELHKDFHLYT